MSRCTVVIYLVFLAHHVLHLAALGYWIAVARNESQFLATQYRNRFKFLTVWNIILQTVYLFGSVVRSVLIINQKDKLVRSLSKVLRYANIALVSPLGVYVSLSFWMIYTIDRELIYPKIIDTVFPRSANHAAHSSIVLLPLMEMFTQRDVDLPKFKSTLIGLSCFLAAFVYTLFGTYYFDSVWLYGFMGVLSWPAKMWFVVVTYTVNIAILCLVTLVHTNLLSSNMEKQKSN